MTDNSPRGLIKKVLREVGFADDPKLDALVNLAAAIQNFRAKHSDPERRSSTSVLTRSSVLYAIGELEPSVRKILQMSGLNWSEFQKRLDLESLPKPRDRKDAKMDSHLQEALWRFPERQPNIRSMRLLPAIALAITESLIEHPKSGSLPTLLRKLGVKFDTARFQLYELALASSDQAAELEPGSKQAPEGSEQIQEPGSKRVPEPKPKPKPKEEPEQEPEPEPEQEQDSEPEPEPEPEEFTPAHLDDPTSVDQLNRRPFAEVMALRIRQIRDLGDKNDATPRSFAVHIHGPWGAGKTSVLNFIRKNLESTNSGVAWVVIDFNAWRHQQIRPPWWSLIRQVYQQALSTLIENKERRKAIKLRWQWFVWRLRADWMPVVLAALLILLILLFVGGNLFPATETITATNTTFVKNVETGLKVVTMLFVAWAGALAFGRSMLFGSAKAAQSYMELSDNPMGPISRLFEKLVDVIDPVAIFIDDLDRCDPDYVVELLEGVQTLFRRANATYVVAADRNWIRVSYERHYVDFKTSIAEPGRPLGYLFLEKLFQVSASLPQLSTTMSDSYWLALLKGDGHVDNRKLEETVRHAEEQAETLLQADSSPEEMVEIIDQYENDPIQQQGLRAVAAKRVSTPAAERRRQHFLQPFAPLLERNPRAMKRLINAYGIQQAVSFLEGRVRLDTRALALWTIIEMRWPLLADCLSKHPALIAEIGTDDPTDKRIPDTLNLLFSSAAVKRVVDGEGLNPPVSLTETNIREMIGSSPHGGSVGVC